MNNHNDTIHNKSVIFFSSDDWNEDLKTSKFHMAKSLENDGYKVLYINSIGLRRQQISLNIVKKIINRLKTILYGVKKVSDNIYVFTPFIIPFHSLFFVSTLNKLFLFISIKLLQVKYRLYKPELWVFLPNHVQMLKRFGESISIYYCVDEHALFSGVDTEMMKKLELQLLKSVDLVVVTAKPLYDSKAANSKSILYLPHGVDVEHFSRAVSDQLEKPGELAAISGKCIGFFGLIEDWIDLELVLHCAKELPDCTFIMIGRNNVNIDKYKLQKNIQFLGPKKFEILPNYCRYFDCAIMPFKINDMTLNVNPLKMREYLAAGVQVVSTALPEARNHNSYVKIANTHDEFILHIKQVLQENVSRALISESVKGDSWAARYHMLREKINSLSK